MKGTLVVCTLFILSIGMLTNALTPSSILAQTDGLNQNSSNPNINGTMETNNTETENSQIAESGQISKRGG